MKDFFHYRESLLESSLPGSIKGELNKLQQWYDDNAMDMGFVSKKDPSSVKVFPILERPFDLIKRGGILVLGYNPGAGNNAGELYKKAIEKVRERDNAGKLPLVFDKEKGGWHYILTQERDGTAEVGVRKTQEEIKFSHFNTDKWYAGGNRGFKLHSKGSFNYYRAMNKMLDDLGMKASRSKLMAANYIPFPSSNVKALGKGKQTLIDISTPWVRQFIKVSSPSIIFCPLEVFDILDEKIGIDTSKRNLNAKGLYRSGTLRDSTGAPVVAFAHWTGSQSGGPTKKSWNEKSIGLIQRDIKRMLGV